MTKKYSTRKALMASVLSLALCFTMLLGTTFAWFTDTATSANNIIKSGNLDVVLEYWDGDSWEDAEGTVIPFVAADGRAQDQILWEPGCTYEMAPFHVRNEGNLNAKILILLNGVVGNEKLMEVIELKTRVNNIPDSLLNGSGGNVFQRLEDAELDIFYGVAEGNVVFDHSLAGKGQVTAGTGHTDTSPEFTIVGRMAKEAGNEYQGLAIEGISISVIATQQTYESDSFGKYYDQNAQFPTLDYAYIANGAPATKIGDGKVAVTVPAGVPAGGYQVKVSNENTATDENGLTTFSADIELLRDGVKVQADGTTLYPVEINIGADMQVARVLHNGEELTNYSYDSATGIVAFETDSFSPFSVIFEKSKAIKVTSADELKALLGNVTEPVIIDATGVSVNISELGVADGSRTTWNLEGGATIKGLTLAFTNANQGVYVQDGANGGALTFVECTFIGEGYVSEAVEFHSGTDSANTKIVFEKCNFAAGKLRIAGSRCAGVEFNGCVFDLNSAGYGSILCMGGSQTFNQCDFKIGNSGAISFFETTYEKFGRLNLLADQTEHYATTVTVNGCTNVPKTHNTNSGSYINEFVENP